MRTTRVLPLALASVLALAATGCGAEFKKDAPQTAVRGFLVEAVVTENGQRACDYLTQDAQNALARTGFPGETCRDSLERADLVEDGESITSTGEIKDLDYSVEENGEEATVTVEVQGSPTMTFELKHDEGLGNLYKPLTPWRITGGAEPLLQGS